MAIDATPFRDIQQALFPLPTSTAPAVGDAKVVILLVDAEQRSRRFKTAFAPNS